MNKAVPYLTALACAVAGAIVFLALGMPSWAIVLIVIGGAAYGIATARLWNFLRRREDS